MIRSNHKLSSIRVRVKIIQGFGNRQKFPSGYTILSLGLIQGRAEICFLDNTASMVTPLTSVSRTKVLLSETKVSAVRRAQFLTFEKLFQRPVPKLTADSSPLDELTVVKSQ